MSDAKKLFLNNQPLRDQWSAVSHADWFKLVLMHVRSELMDTPGLNSDRLAGAQAYESILLSIADEEPEGGGYPSSGLTHDLDRKK